MLVLLHRMKRILLFTICLFTLQFAKANPTTFVQASVRYSKAEAIIRQHISLPTNQFQVHTAYFTYIDSTGKKIEKKAFFHTDEQRLYGNYWHTIVEQQLPLNIYQCFISILNQKEDTIFRQKQTIYATYTKTDGPQLSHPFTYAAQLPISFPLQLIENFCDTTINAITTEVQILDPIKSKNTLYLYTRFTKKNKPNFIIFSKVDTILVSSSLPPVIEKKSEIPLFGLQSGNYIVYTRLYADKTLLETRENLIQILRPKIDTIKKNTIAPLPENSLLVNIENTFVQKYPLAVLQKNLQTLQPLSAAAEWRSIQSLVNSTDELMLKRFFYNFWEVRNPKNPELGWKEYAARLNECIKKYYGVKNDQASIFLKYGKPDLIEEVPNEPNTIPYEIWQYDNLVNAKNAVFLFIQSAGNVSLDKVLLHSTHPLELHYPAWRQFLIKGQGQSNRVFEFIKEGN